MTFIWVWGPALVWMAVTFYISHQSVVSIPLGAPDGFGSKCLVSINSCLLILEIHSIYFTFKIVT